MSSGVIETVGSQASSPEIPEAMQSKLRIYYGYSSRLRECRADIAKKVLSIHKLQLENGANTYEAEKEALGELRSEEQSLEESVRETEENLGVNMGFVRSDNGDELPQYRIDFNNYCEAIKAEGRLFSKMLRMRAKFFRQLEQFKKEEGGDPDELLNVDTTVAGENDTLVTVVNDTKMRVKSLLKRVDELNVTMMDVEQQFLNTQADEEPGTNDECRELEILVTDCLRDLWNKKEAAVKTLADLVSIQTSLEEQQLILEEAKAELIDAGLIRSKRKKRKAVDKAEDKQEKAEAKILKLEKKSEGLSEKIATARDLVAGINEEIAKVERTEISSSEASIPKVPTVLEDVAESPTETVLPEMDSEPAVAEAAEEEGTPELVSQAEVEEPAADEVSEVLSEEVLSEQPSFETVDQSGEPINGEKLIPASLPPQVPVPVEVHPEASLPNAEGLVALMNRMGEIGAISIQLSEISNQREQAMVRRDELRQENQRLEQAMVRKEVEHEQGMAERVVQLDKREEVLNARETEQEEMLQLIESDRSAISAREDLYASRIRELLKKMKGMEHLFPSSEE